MHDVVLCDVQTTFVLFILVLEGVIIATECPRPLVVLSGRESVLNSSKKNQINPKIFGFHPKDSGSIPGLGTYFIIIIIIIYLTCSVFYSLGPEKQFFVCFELNKNTYFSVW